MEKKIRRAEKKIVRFTEKYPQLLKQDTIRDTIRVYVPKVYTDTAFVPVEGDTVFIDKDRLSIRYVTRNDSVFIEGECKSDTIYKTIEIPVETIVVRKQTIVEQLTAWARSFWWIIVLVALILFIVKVGWKFIKPF